MSNPQAPRVEALPELPEPSAFAPQMVTEDAYTAEQMRQYARDALVNAYRDGTLREALRDAERYRWLRERMIAEELRTQWFPSVPAIVNRPLDPSEDTAPEFDAAIDAAIAAQAESGGGKDG